jgi:Putative  PD-(D/E)XK family member, (DUF4420)
MQHANQLKRIDASHPLDIYIGTDAQGRRILVLFSEQKVGEAQLFHGLEVSISQRADSRFVLCFTLTSRESSELFERVSHDLITATRNATPDQPERLWDQFCRWRRLFAEKNGGRLSESEVRGLIGELLVLSRLLTPQFGIAASLGGWTGPYGARHDFALSVAHFEVKTLLEPSDTVRISSPAQLEPPQDTALKLVTVHLSAAEADTTRIDLHSAVAEVSGLTGNDGALLRRFEDALSAVGYRTGDDYSGTGYRPAKIVVYSVTPEFPRIRPVDIAAAITSVSWDLHLSMISGFIAEHTNIDIGKH